MVIFGWTVFTIGLCCFAGALALEAKTKEAIWHRVYKVAMGVMALGGAILGISTL